jgi:DNA-binding CsgD family transcriptional regulator
MAKHRAVSAGILDIVEGAYETSNDEVTWLTQATERFASRCPQMMSWGGYIISRTPDGLPIFHNACLAGYDDPMSVFGPMHDTLTPEFAAVAFPNGTDCRLFSEHWKAASEGRSWQEDPQVHLDRLWSFLASCGAEDLIYSLSFDRKGAGVFLGAMVKHTKLSPRSSELFRRAAIHLAAGLRLRRSLMAASPFERCEAVLEADGRLAHAEGGARDVDARAELREAAKRIDRARTAKVREDEIEATSLWQGLVEGRWSVIDRFDTDGRRYYVAIANPPEGVPVRQLSEIEARVVAQAAAGEPNGVVAYALGVAETTVGSHLTNAMRKLGAQSRIELVRLAQALGA